MIDTSVMANLSSKLQDLKSNYKSDYKSDSKNTDNKADFKNYLSKEVKSNTSEAKSNTSKNASSTSEKSIENKDSGKSEISNKELASKISENIEKLLNNEDLDIESLGDDLQEILYLLLNLIVVNPENFQENNYENIEDVQSNILEELNNLNLNDNNRLFNEEGNKTFTFNEDNILPETNKVLKNINSLLAQYKDNVNDSTAKVDDSLNNIKSDLLKEIKDLVNILPEEIIDEAQNNLDSGISKEVLKALILNTNKDSKVTEDNLKSNDIKENALNNVEIKIDKDETNVNLNDDFKEDNFNDSKTSKENSINKEEEKVLMKILDDDSNQSFSKTLNYYDKLNKVNSTIEVVNEPGVISRDNVNLDFIKNIRYMVKNSIEELNVKIYPKELGEITIKLLSEEGIMKAEIKATSKETYNLLNSNMNEIKKTLENQNIRIQEVNIGIYNEDTTFFSGREKSKDSFNEKKMDKINIRPLEEEEIVEDLLNEGNVNLLA